MEHLGPYRLLSRLGGDGGAVHRAAGPDGRDVAIRLLPPDAAPDIDRMRGVLSPYAVDVLDGEPAPPRPYVVSRFVPGRPLAEVVAEQGRLAGGDLRRLAFGLAKALDAVHGAGLVHGDLGPDSILMVDGAPVVVDFGLTAGAGVAGDVRAWAAAVTFAATGAPLPDRAPDALPADLRPLVAAAAAPDPGARPTAAELVEAVSRLELPAARPGRPAGEAPAAPPVRTPEPAPAAPEGADPEPDREGPERPARAGRRGPGVARGWARLLAALVMLIAVAAAVIAPVAGLLLTLGAVTLLRAAGADGGPARRFPAALGRTLVTVPYAAAAAVAVPLGLVAVSALGGRVDSLTAAAFGAGAGAAVLWTAPGVDTPRRQLVRTFLPVARRPRRAAAAVAVLSGLTLVAGVGALSLTPSFSPLYGLQNSVEGTMDRLQTAVNRF